MLPTNTSDLHTPAYLRARKTWLACKKSRFCGVYADGTSK
jgi:hypothetical protein